MDASPLGSTVLVQGDLCQNWTSKMPTQSTYVAKTICEDDLLCTLLPQLVSEILSVCSVKETLTVERIDIYIQ